MSETNGEGPLQGLKVVDLTEFMAGPYCTAILADMGADVIKVERPNGGDSIRDWHGHPRNPQFCYMNRNKRSLTLNFKTPEGREILLGLIKQSDVLVENFRATTMERAGFGYETLIAHNPALIYCSISGFGYDGPYRAKGGLDLIRECGRSPASSPRCISVAAPGAGNGWNVRCWKRRSPIAPGPARVTWQTNRSRAARAPAIGSPLLTSALLPGTASS